LTGEFAINSRQILNTEAISSGKIACLMIAIAEKLATIVAAIGRPHGISGTAECGTVAVSDPMTIGSRFIDEHAFGRIDTSPKISAGIHERNVEYRTIIA
jgi:hypothetical protein